LARQFSCLSPVISDHSTLCMAVPRKLAQAFEIC
jgi:hypothetical protein